MNINSSQNPVSSLVPSRSVLNPAPNLTCSSPPALPHLTRGGWKSPACGVAIVALAVFFILATAVLCFPLLIVVIPVILCCCAVGCAAASVPRPKSFSYEPRSHSSRSYEQLPSSSSHVSVGGGHVTRGPGRVERGRREVVETSSVKGHVRVGGGHPNSDHVSPGFETDSRQLHATRPHVTRPHTRVGGGH